MRAFAAVLASVATATSMFQSDTYDFMKWCNEHNKDYNTFEEFQARFQLWKEKHDFINEFNKGDATHRVAHNFLSDFTTEELTAMNGYKYDPTRVRNIGHLPPTNEASVDWREQGAVTDVKNQGSCGSCWSFSTTGCLEGANFLATGTLTSLSEQQFVDCDKGNGDMGCNGGLMDNAFTYAKTAAIESEADYPYTGKSRETCAYDASKGVVNVTSFTDVAPSDAAAMKAAVAQQPVSVAIQANQLAFQLYHSGIISSNCGTRLDHGVLTVGYGEEDGTEYWIVKNSWGDSWGEDGYLRIAIQDGDGVCGIQMEPSWATTQAASAVQANEAIVFTQTAGQDKFIMDTSQTSCDPAYPTKGTTAKFTVGGTWLQAETLTDVEFKVLMNGTALADIPEADAESTTPGMPWTKTFSFPIPSFAPSGTYDVTVAARDSSQTHFWEISTSFTL